MTARDALLDVLINAAIGGTRALALMDAFAAEVRGEQAASLETEDAKTTLSVPSSDTCTSRADLDKALMDSINTWEAAAYGTLDDLLAIWNLLGKTYLDERRKARGEA